MIAVAAEHESELKCHQVGLGEMIVNGLEVEVAVESEAVEVVEVVEVAELAVDVIAIGMPIFVSVESILSLDFFNYFVTKMIVVIFKLSIICTLMSKHILVKKKKQTRCLLSCYLFD